MAIIFAVWRSVVTERQADTTQRQFEIAQRGLLNERYQKGAEMLGSMVLSVRIGGIYALAGLAREHPEDYHTKIMRLLCAFVRNPTGEPTKPPLLERQAKLVKQNSITGLRKRTKTAKTTPSA